MTENKIEKISQPNSDTASTTGDTISVSKTLLIFDFDDTLFCTNYFDSFTLPYKDIFDFKVSLEQTNTCLFKEIEELEKNLLELFSKLQNNDLDIAIVSNADLKWINNCLIHFLPEFRDYIQENGIKIYSAKNIVSNDKNGNSKIKCFEKALNDVYSKEANAENEAELNLELNVIGIGDGIDEKKAVFSLCKNKEKFNFCQNIRAKFIRMIDYPSASAIILQLNYLLNNINTIIESNKTIFTMNIEVTNGCTKVKCIPKKKRYKIDKIKTISNSYENNKKLNIIDDNDDFFLIKDELENDIYNLEKEENLARKCLFLGKKTFLKNEFLQYNI
jgi:hypothetical protein